MKETAKVLKINLGSLKYILSIGSNVITRKMFLILNLCIAYVNTLSQSFFEISPKLVCKL